MKKWLIGFLLAVSVLAFAPVASAGSIEVSDVVLASGTVNIAVAGTTAVVYTKAIDISDAEYFAVGYYANAGTVAVTIQIEQSSTKPDTEGAADADFTVPVNMPDVVTNLTTEEIWYSKSINPIAKRWLRFKVSGLTGNDAGSIIKMHFSRKQD